MDSVLVERMCAPLFRHIVVVNVIFMTYKEDLIVGGNHLDGREIMRKAR